MEENAQFRKDMTWGLLERGKENNANPRNEESDFFVQPALWASDPLVP